MRKILDRQEIACLTAMVVTLCHGLLEIVDECHRQRDIHLLLEKLCGQWQSTSSHSRFLIFTENGDFKLMFMKKRGILRKLSVETYPILTDARWPYFMAGTDMNEPQVIFYNPGSDVIRFGLKEEFTRTSPCREDKEDTVEVDPGKEEETLREEK